MEVEKIIYIMRLLAIVMNISIVIVYSLSLYWHMKLVFTTMWTPYSSIKIGLALASLGFAIAYGYLLYSSFMGSPVTVTIFGAMVVRPLILLQGSFLSASARAKNTIAKHGGETWILRKYKTLLDG